jgi:hypothetical protein
MRAQLVSVKLFEFTIDTASTNINISVSVPELQVYEITALFLVEPVYIYRPPLQDQAK